ncbi:MAG: hypothetical protein U0T69_08055 [Chitinophagales bacterium]
MQHQLLSRRLTSIKIFLFVLIVFTWIITFASDEIIKLDNIVGAIIFSTILLIIFYYLTRLKKIEFDKEFMYINGIEAKIPLEDIYEIRYSPLSYAYTKGLGLSVIKIIYKKDEIMKSVRVLPSKFSNKQEEFENIIKIKNPHLKIKPFYISFWED